MVVVDVNGTDAMRLLQVRMTDIPSQKDIDGVNGTWKAQIWLSGTDVYAKRQTQI